MKVKLKFYDVWEMLTGTRELDIEFEDGMTAEELFNYVVNQFKVENPETLLETVFISSESGSFRAIVRSEIVTDGSTILFSGPVIGG